MQWLGEKYRATFLVSQEKYYGHNCDLLTDVLPRKSLAWRGHMYMLEDLIDSLDLIHVLWKAG